MVTLYFRTKKLAWTLAKGINTDYYHIYSYGKIKGEKPYYITYRRVK